jgi:nicotinamidase-related amidase
MKNKKALLVIDLQKGFFTMKVPIFDAERVIMRINKLAKIFRELNYPVVYIQHDGTGTSNLKKTIQIGKIWTT